MRLCLLVGVVGDRRGIAREPALAIMYNDTVGYIPPGIGLEVVNVTHKWEPAQVADLVERYDAGESVQRLAASQGISRNAINRLLVGEGRAIRDRSSGQRARHLGTTVEERLAMTAAAHDAKRGRPNTWEARCRAAQTREQSGAFATAREQEFIGLLVERGLHVTPQRAIGPYNCDLAAGTIAVEIFGGNWHATGDHAARYPERCDYILDQGWHLLIAWNQSRDPLSAHAADYLVAFHEFTERNPTAPREYRVIRGCGELLARGERPFDHLALVPSQRRTPSHRT
jgi:very-short-patch-repair endonuclease